MMDRDKNSVEEAISFISGIERYYINQRNNIIMFSPEYRKFAEEALPNHNSVLNKIQKVHAMMEISYRQYQKLIASGQLYEFGGILEESQWEKLIVNLFSEIKKIEELNIIPMLNAPIKEKINYLKEIWKIDDIIISTWRDYINTDNDEAYKRLVEENEVLKRKIEDISSKLEIAKKLGYVPLYSLPNNLLIPKKASNK